MIADETILAYVDGELGETEAVTLEAEIAADPALARRVADHRALREAAAGAFAKVLAEPIPDRLLAAAMAEPAVVRADFGRSRRLAVPGWAAMAASLVVGVMLGQGVAMLNRSPISAGARGLEARGELAGALDRNLAADAGPVRLGVSFRNAERSYCRSFVIERDTLAGVACHEHGRWAVRMTAEPKPGEAGGYRMAASAMPPAVLSAIDTMMVGEPLDRAGEEAARRFRLDQTLKDKGPAPLRGPALPLSDRRAARNAVSLTWRPRKRRPGSRLPLSDEDNETLGHLLSAVEQEFQYGGRLRSPQSPVAHEPLSRPAAASWRLGRRRNSVTGRSSLSSASMVAR